jgi:hypothetical protein
MDNLCMMPVINTTAEEIRDERLQPSLSPVPDASMAQQLVHGKRSHGNDIDSMISSKRLVSGLDHHQIIKKLKNSTVVNIQGKKIEVNDFVSKPTSLVSLTFPSTTSIRLKMDSSHSDSVPGSPLSSKSDNEKRRLYIADVLGQAAAVALEVEKLHKAPLMTQLEQPSDQAQPSSLRNRHQRRNSFVIHPKLQSAMMFPGIAAGTLPTFDTSEKSNGIDDVFPSSDCSTKTRVKKFPPGKFEWTATSECMERNSSAPLESGSCSDISNQDLPPSSSLVAMLGNYRGYHNVPALTKEAKEMYGYE